jgi:hypothetical protein
MTFEDKLLVVSGQSILDLRFWILDEFRPEGEPVPKIPNLKSKI